MAGKAIINDMENKFLLLTIFLVFTGFLIFASPAVDADCDYCVGWACVSSHYVCDTWESQCTDWHTVCVAFDDCWVECTGDPPLESCQTICRCTAWGNGACRARTDVCVAGHTVCDAYECNAWTPYCGRTESSCGCSTCVDCSDTYGTACGYGTCTSAQKPSWYCKGGAQGNDSCDYNCNLNPVCPCSEHTDCNDSDNCTQDICVTPGTPSCTNPLWCSGADTECACQLPCLNCNNQDGWYSDGTADYSCCDKSGGKEDYSTCQEQEYRDYYCSNYSCEHYNITDHRTHYTLVERCNDSDTWYDVVTGNDGVIYGGGHTSDTPDTSDFALEFDGGYDSYIEMPDSKSLDIQDEISVEAWVKSETQILPPWYSTSWEYRKAIDVTGSSAIVTDYQVLLTLNTEELISQGKMKDDCSDIRVTKSDTITEIPFYTAGGCNTVSTSIWAKVPSISSAGTTVYVYYGNPSAVSESDKDAVFDLFDSFEQEGGLIFEETFEDGNIHGWTTGGSANWSAVSGVASAGSWSAKSGDIGNSQTTYIQRTVTGPATINFHWKVSSQHWEHHYGVYYTDYLKFYVDGAQVWAISGAVDWHKKTYTIPAGNHTIKWEYVKDGYDGYECRQDSGWIDDITVTEGGLGEGWTTGGSKSWYPTEEYPAHTGSWSAKSGEIGNSKSTYIERTVTGPATINFHWKVSSQHWEHHYGVYYTDYLKFYVDGAQVWAISGAVDWHKKTYTIPAGNHTIKWEYVKDGYDGYECRQDSGWIDDIMKRKSVSPEPVSGTPYCERERIKARRIFSKGDSYLLKINLDGTQAYGEINGNWVTASVPAPQLNAWHHYVLTYNKNKQILYIDGKKEAQTNFSQTINRNANNLMIGETFSGVIDEARIYKRALTKDEVKEHFTGVFKDETDLIGLWHLDEGIGSTAVDTISQICTGECDCSFTRKEYRDYYCTPDCAYDITDYETTSVPCVICLSDAECDDGDICTADVCPLPWGTLPCEYSNYCTLDDEINCGCEADDCKDCSDIYGEACGYNGSAQGFCHCVADEKPTWSCNGTDCECVCAFDALCIVNVAPVAQITCNPAVCSGYIADGFSFNNDSTDADSTNPPDMDNDIKKSRWYVDGAFDTQYVGSNTMNLFPPSLIVGDHIIELEVEDDGGLLNKTVPKNFRVKLDAKANFMCSVDKEEPKIWHNCATFVPRIFGTQWVYFKDISSVSGGASGISSWKWEQYIPETSSWEVFGTVSLAQLRFEKSNRIKLTIVDDVGRRASREYLVGAKIITGVEFEETI